MTEQWSSSIFLFIELADKFGVRMIMVGGGAVNFHGYQRHSADVNFWIETTEDNLSKLIHVFREMNYDLDDFPAEVKCANQNISVKFSPEELTLELITRFSVDKSFEQAYQDAEVISLDGLPVLKWRVLCFDDLILSKIKASRPKDLLDIQELKRLKS